MQTAVFCHTVFQKINLHAVQVHAVLAIKSLCPWRDYRLSCTVQHSQRAEQSKARLSIHRLSLSVLEPAAEPQLQLEGMLLKLNSGSRKHSRQRQQPNKRVTLGGMARIVCVCVLCAFVCEGGELAAISPAGLTSDTRHLQIFCQKKEASSWSRSGRDTRSSRHRHQH